MVSAASELSCLVTSSRIVLAPNFARRICKFSGPHTPIASFPALTLRLRAIVAVK